MRSRSYDSQQSELIADLTELNRDTCLRSKRSHHLYVSLAERRSARLTSDRQSGVH